jgi:hypothetical protein
MKYFCVFLVWAISAGLSRYENEIAPIPSARTAAYKESREYIARDAAAHTECKSAMLDNAPDIAAYYGYADMPLYSPEGNFDVLYVLNDIFRLDEPDMYEELYRHNLDDNNILKIRVNNDTVVFKKYLR